MSTALRIACFLSFLLTATPAGRAQEKADARLLGGWVGTGESNTGNKITVEESTLVMDGARVPLRFVAPGVIEVGPAGQQERVTYTLDGDMLTVKDSEETTTWRREKQQLAPPKPAFPKLTPPAGNPLGDDRANPLGKSGNPLAKAPQDPFARKWTGEGIALELTGAAGSGYRGTLTVRGDSYPVQASATGTSLRGTFRVEQQEFELTAEVTGDAMALTSGGSEYRLTGEKLAPTNPLAAGKQRVGAQEIAADTAPARGTKVFVNQKSGVACHLPEDWTLLNESPQGCVINPGFQQGQMLAVTITLHCLPIPAEQAAMAIEDLLTGEVPGTRQSLRDNAGIDTGEPGPIQRIDVGGKPGAAVTMPAQTPKQQRGSVWFALHVEDGKCLVCNAIFLGDTEAKYLPQVKKVFASLRPAASAAREVAPRPDRGDPEDPRRREQGVVMLQKRTFTDPGFGGIESHTMYLPRDWTGEGGVRWTGGGSGVVHFVGSFAGPDGATVSFDYNRHFSHSTDRGMLDAMARDTARDPSGVTGVAAPPQRPGEAAVQQIIPRLRPAATGVRLVEAKTSPEAEAKTREALAPILQAMSQGVTTNIHCERALVAYDEDGRSWEELVQYTAIINVMPFRTQFINYDTAMWEVSAVRSYRAPLGELQRHLPRLVMIADTLQPTPRWSISLADLRTELSKIQHQTNMQTLAAIAERGKIIAQKNAEIADMRLSSWQQQQTANDRAHRAAVNSILEVHDWRSRDGRSIPIDHSYGRVFQDSLGNLVLTNDPSYDPSADPATGTRDWSQLQRADQTGR